MLHFIRSLQEAIPITADLIVTLWAGLWSLLLEYFPGLAAWMDKQNDQIKKLVTAGGLLIVVVGAVLAACYHIIEGYSFTCDSPQKMIVGAIQLFFLAIAMNQGIHLISKRAG